MSCYAALKLRLMLVPLLMSFLSLPLLVVEGKLEYGFAS